MAKATQLIEAELLSLGFTDKGTHWERSVGSMLVRATPTGRPNVPYEVDYGADIKVGHRSAVNLGKPENVVTLDCVCTLLERGYAARDIELEPVWKLGRREKGRLDVLLRRPSGETYAMIECKTWGSEYSKERNNLLEDGGQLFSYFVQDRDAQALYLYASHFDASRAVSRQIEFLETKKLKGRNVVALFASWDQRLFRDGLFRGGLPLYADATAPLTRADLKELDFESGRGLFNGFAEVLRRHVLSDKVNAFNKIFNLFVCKLQDEDNALTADYFMECQLKYEDRDADLVARLVGLYRQGLGNYLNISVEAKYHSEIAEFAFIDVYDKATYERNAVVLREVVQLLQHYQLRYSGKQQFLGDFFEMLLDTGVKQEAGQFFTPAPLARFTVRSLPLVELTQENLSAGRADPLPNLVDYACGAGHFLTEGVAEYDERPDEILGLPIPRSGLKKLEARREDFGWARNISTASRRTIG